MARLTKFRRLLWGAWWRKTLVIIVLLVGLYALLGFFAVPAIVQWQLPKQVAVHTTGKATVGDVAFNPFTFDFRAANFALTSGAGKPLVAFEKLDVNFDPARIVTGAMAFAWIRLQSPRIDAAVDKDGKLNFAALAKPGSEKPPEKKQEKKKKALPTVEIDDLAVTGGHVAYTDRSQSRDFHLALNAVQFHLKDFSTRPRDDGRYHFHASLGNGQSIVWRGTLGVAPLRSQGRLNIAGLDLAQLWPYMANRFDIKLTHGRLGVQGRYKLQQSSDGLQLGVSDGQVSLDKLDVVENDNKRSLVKLPALKLDNVAFKLQQGQLTVGNIKLKKLALLGGGKGGPLVVLPALDIDNTQFNLHNKQLEVAGVTLDGLALLPNAGAHPRVVVPKLKLSDVALDLNQRRVDIRSVTTSDGKIKAVMDKKHKLDLLQQIQAVKIPPIVADTSGNAAAENDAEKHQNGKNNQGKSAPKTASKPFSVVVHSVAVKDYAVSATDRSQKKPVSFDLKPINIDVKNVSTGGSKPLQLEAHVGLSGGAFSLNGPVKLKPLSAKLKLGLKHLPLAQFQPYVAEFAHVKLDKGALWVTGKLDVASGKAAPDIAFDGRLDLNGLDVNSAGDNKPFVQLHQLAIKGIHYSNQPAVLNIGTIDIDQPFAKLVVNPDRSTNVSDLMVARPQAGKTTTKPSAKSASAGEPMKVSVDEVAIKQGKLNFSDLSMQPNVSVGIEKLHGGVQHFSTRPGDTAHVDLEGEVGPYAPVTIKGKLQPLAKAITADIAVNFKNLGLTAFSPYSGKFAGYRIKKGKASLTLDYDIQKGLMKGKNKVVLDQLQLGEKVDSPDAVHLPLKLALALLRDSHGVINLDLPVHGDLNDPKFAIGPLIWKVFVNVLKKAATSPFHMLAKLVGGHASGLNHVDFAPGQSSLDAADKEGLSTLAKALEKRPSLMLNITGATAPTADRDALARQQLLARIRKKGQHSETGQPLSPQDEKALFAQYKAEFHVAAPEKVKRKPGEKEAAYHARVVKVALKQLVAQEKISKAALEQLAGARANAVRDYLVQQAKLNPDRIFLLNGEQNAVTKKGSVKLPLKVSVK